MGRSTTAAASGAAKTPLTEEEQAALTTYYELKIIEGSRKVDALLVDMKAARDLVNGHYKRMTADLHFTRKEIAAVLVQDWMRGYHAGQEYNGLQLGRAAEILARPKPGIVVAGENPDDVGADDDEPDLDAEARALKASGWVAPTEDEAKFEEADGGKTIRQPRAGRSTVSEQAAA